METKKENQFVEILVKDTGIGIKEEDLGKLFQLFGFINATEEINTQGIGLGLHISKQIVVHLGGEIVCKSTWGKGSTFIFLV